VDEAPGLGEGVADGTVDSREWISNGELRGAWIRLDWDKPATIEEIELYDRPSAEENLTSGSLTFDDGSMVGVPPLPPDGSAWRVSFPPKTVRSLVLRIDSVEGRSAGLAEIMVFGTMNP
jgi:hypothetical protein